MRTTALERRTRLRFPIVLAILVAATAAVSYFMFGPMRHGELTLIDDHEILRFLGPDHAIWPWDIPRILLTETEVGRWGQSVRFRPVYYAIRLIEAALWKDSGFWWYGVRTAAIVVVASWAGSFAIRRAWGAHPGRARLVLGVVLGAAVSALIVAMPAWGDIATRLGPSEVYVALALIPLVIGIDRAWRSPASPAGWIVMTIGFLLAAGSKEDAVLLAVPVVVIWVVRAPRLSERGALPLILVVLCLAFAAWITAGLLLATASSQTDQYGNGRSIALLLRALPTNSAFWAALAALVASIAIEWRSGRASGGAEGLRHRLAAHPATLTAAACLVVIVGDTYFYQNYISAGVFIPARYGMLSYLAALVVVVVVVLHLLRRSWVSRPRDVAVSALSLLAVALLPIVPAVASAASMRATSIALSHASQQVHDEVLAAVDVIKATPGAQSVIIVHRATDVERVFSLPQFLAYYGGVDSVILEWQGDDTAQRTPLDRQVDRMLASIAKDGRQTDGWRISPASSYDPAAPAVCFVFTQTEITLDCTPPVRQIG